MRRALGRLRALINRARLEYELDEEMRLHIDLEAADLARTRGLAPDEARRQAMIAFGGVERYREAHRDARGARGLEDLARDTRYAIRALARAPGFTVPVMLVLALVIGATTAAFSAVDAVLISRLPYPDDVRLVRIVEQSSPENRWNTSTADYQAIVEQQRSFSAVGAVRRSEGTVTAGGEPRRERVAAASAGFFAALGVRPAAGRTIEASDESPGAPPVVVIGQDFATRLFPASPLGRSLTIDGTAFTVVGVLPAGIRDLAGTRSELWTALQLTPPTRRGPFALSITARLKDGVTLDAARRDLAAVSERLLAQWSADFHDANAKLTPYPLRDWILGDASRALGIFGAAVLLVLLIAVANAASLMLARVSGRGREMTLRLVLGASRARIARLLMTESIGVALLGTAAGLALAWVVLHALVITGAGMPRLAEARLDPRAIAFAVGTGIAAGAIIGAYPILALFRGALAPALRSGDREVGAGRRTHALRGALVGAQFALVLPLLAGAGLLLNSFLRLQRVNVGFDPSRLVFVHVSLPRATYRDPAAMNVFWSRAVARLRSIPGITDAGVNNEMPGEESGDFDNFDLLDRPVPSGTSEPTAVAPQVTPGFFAAAGIPLLEGRLFTSGDSDAAPPVIIVSRSWVRRFSPDRPAVGRQLFQGGCRSCPPTTIIGVVGDVKYQGLSGDGIAMYNAAAQSSLRDGNVFARTSGPPSAAVERARDALRSLDPSLALDDAGAVGDRVAATITPQRQWTTLLGGFAVAALLLAAVGIFGMLSYLVAARTREIGVRVALGARQREIVLMILRRGMSFAAIGALAGLALTMLSGRWLAGVLFGVGATDPITLASVTLALLAVALAACWLPARRAAALTPMDAIRDD